LVIVMLQSVSRQHVVDDLERLGYRELVPEALQELPDPVDIDRLEEWCSQHGIPLDELISRMGGSP
jgi:arsenate reductase-like glutaredoxin family protein